MLSDSAEELASHLPLCQVQPGYLLALVNIAVEHGYSLDTLCREFGFTMDQLQDVGNSIPLELYLAVVDQLIRDNRVPGIGLLHGHRVKVCDHGPKGFIGNALLCSDNLKMAIELAVKYQGLFNMPLRHYAEYHRSGAVTLVLEEPYPAKARVWAIESWLTSWVNVLRTCIGDDAIPERVNLNLECPLYSELYAEFVRCPVHFEQSRNTIELPAELLQRPFVNRNSGMRELCELQCQQQLEQFQPEHSLVQQIESLLTKSLPYRPTCDQTADYLNMSVRSLQRRLSAGGIGYREIMETVRRRCALRYLSETRLPPKRIAYQLGYDHPSNFFHAFKRWYGCTPAQYRATKHSVANFGNE